jgi:Lrp/AsnC family leucine-responsive transcriptional regulator
MRDLDETDLEILQLLLSNARRPYSDIADAVGLSAPAVSDRVARLQERGIINRFTLDVDHSQLRKGIPVLLTLDVSSEGPGVASIKDVLLDEGAVEHVFTTAEADLVVYARVPDNDVSSWLDDTLEDGAIADFGVTLLAGADWSPDLGGTEFALTCAQCGNTVDSEGTATRIDGELYQFCCPSCESRFEEKYEQLQQGVD